MPKRVQLTCVISVIAENKRHAQDLFAYIKSRHGSYTQFPWSPLGTPGTPLFARDQQKKEGCIFGVSLKEARLIT